MRYKVGDKVRVKSLERVKLYRDSCKGISIKTSFVNDMLQYCGKETFITTVLGDDSYRIDIDNMSFSWSDWMLEDIPQEKGSNDYIYGVDDRGDEVIKMLEDCGGVHKHGLLGDTDDLCPKMNYIARLGTTINY